MLTSVTVAFLIDADHLLCVLSLVWIRQDGIPSYKELSKDTVIIKKEGLEG